MQDMELNEVVERQENLDAAELKKLANAWKAMRAELKELNRVNFAVFNDVFARTYSFLSAHSMDRTVEKSNIELIVNSFLFVYTDCHDLDFKSRAALILTERMLNCYALNSTPVSVDGVSVYVLGALDEVCVNFNDVNDSINTLEKLIEADYWKKW